MSAAVAGPEPYQASDLPRNVLGVIGARFAPLTIRARFDFRLRRSAQADLSNRSYRSNTSNSEVRS